MIRNRRTGFTLIEVLVALALTSLAALLAHQLFGAVADHTSRLQGARHSLDRWSNAQRFLQDTFLSLEVGIDSAGPFSGQPDRLGFTAWTPTADGWRERRTLELALRGDRWVALSAPEGAIELAGGVTTLSFDYLLEPGADSKWVAQWESPVSAPLAVRIRVARRERIDTMLFLIKARG